MQFCPLYHQLLLVFLISINVAEFQKLGLAVVSNHLHVQALSVKLENQLLVEKKAQVDGVRLLSKLATATMYFGVTPSQCAMSSVPVAVVILLVP